MWFVSRRTVVAGLLGLLALVGAVLSDAEPSSGHEWRNYLTECAPGGPYVNSTDSATHSFYYSSDATYGLSQLMRDAVSYARQTSYDPTDIYTVNSPVQGLDTDVVAFDWDITGYWCGVNWHYVGAT